jgi:hypothetical protein
VRSSALRGAARLKVRFQAVDGLRKARTMRWCRV